MSSVKKEKRNGGNKTDHFLSLETGLLENQSPSRQGLNQIENEEEKKKASIKLAQRLIYNYNFSEKMTLQQLSRLMRLFNAIFKVDVMTLPRLPQGSVTKDNLNGKGIVMEDFLYVIKDLATKLV